MINQKKTIPLFQSLTRPILLFGAESENIILLTCISLGMATAGKDIISISLGAVIFFGGRLFSKVVAKSDPWATKVFIASLKYQDFYPAREKTNTPKCVIKRKREF
jgi:type IV secretion system protein VirB3